MEGTFEFEDSFLQVCSVLFLELIVHLAFVQFSGFSTVLCLSPGVFFDECHFIVKWSQRSVGF